MCYLQNNIVCILHKNASKPSNCFTTERDIHVFGAKVQGHSLRLRTERCKAYHALWHRNTFILERYTVDSRYLEFQGTL